MVSERFRKPIPVRVDSIGPWLGCLRTLVLVVAAKNIGLVPGIRHLDMTLDGWKWVTFITLTACSLRVFRWVTRFVVERVFWIGSEEQMKSKEIDRRVENSDRLLRARLQGSDAPEDEDTGDFWKQDECPCEAFSNRPSNGAWTFLNGL